ncbi:MAG: TlpA family protein disulfide reductase [Pyrinomonadaceae bacterium]
MTALLVFTLAVSIFSGGDPARPVAIVNRPVAVNGVPQKDAPPRALKPIAEMSWSGFDGAVAKLKDYQGKVIILDFWATYCPPCIEEIPHLKQLQAKHGQQLQVIGLHVGGEEDKPKVPEFVERLAIDYPLATPEDALTSYIFGTDTAIPQTAVFDRNGRLVKKIVGFNESIRHELDEAVRSAIAE